MKTVLFQGDSITDASRVAANADSFWPNALGSGYPNLAGSQILLDHPGEYRVLNRGVSGNRIVDLYARIKADVLNLRPDFLSILMGINGVWHELAYQNGVSAEKFDRVYRMILDEVRAELPACKILLFTPYVMQGTATVSAEDPGKWEFFRTETAKRAAAVKKIAADYGLACVETQPLFDAAAEKSADLVLLTDGVHPAAAGHELLSRAYLRWFESVR